jgi:alkylation response protein AidB-like acyl-CoA dehydrogenase
MRHLTEEQQELRGLARSFAEGELRPHTEAWDRDRTLPGSLVEALGEMGFLGLRVPEEQGGLDLDLPTAALVVEALSWGEAGAGLVVGLHNGPVSEALRRFGSHAQKEDWLPRLASGQCLGVISLEGGGAESADPLCAVRTPEGGWRLDGTVRWVALGVIAGLHLVEALLPEEEGEGSSAFFLVPNPHPGVTLAWEPRTLGLVTACPVHGVYKEVVLPAEALLGSPGSAEGVRTLLRTVGWLFLAAQGVGIGQAALDHALRYSREREQFGTPLRGFDGVAEKLAGMALRVAQSRALLLDAAAELQKALDGAPQGSGLAGLSRVGSLHPPTSVEGIVALARVGAGESATWVADEAVQIFGGYGYMRDYPVEKLMRDAKGAEIYLGTNETLRALAVKSLDPAVAN